MIIFNFADVMECRSLANGMVVGISEGFVKDLQLIGVGYRGAVAGNKLNMNLGFSHPVEMEIPQDVEVKVGLSATAECMLQGYALYLLCFAMFTPAISCPLPCCAVCTSPGQYAYHQNKSMCIFRALMPRSAVKHAAAEHGTDS